MIIYKPVSKKPKAVHLSQTKNLIGNLILSSSCYA
jgi:hypothetical protein